MAWVKTNGQLINLDNILLIEPIGNGNVSFTYAGYGGSFGVSIGTPERAAAFVDYVQERLDGGGVIDTAEVPS